MLCSLCQKAINTAHGYTTHTQNKDILADIELCKKPKPNQTKVVFFQKNQSKNQNENSGIEQL